MPIQYIAYYRVSTQKQGKQGWGIAAQRAVINHFAQKAGAQLLEHYTEVESGKDIENRPILQQAIDTCEAKKATLIVARLDRLSRDVEHVFQLKKRLADRLICCDLPNTDSLTLSIFAGLAQRERELISIRIKAALKEKKARGEKLGTPKNLTQIGRALGRKAQQEKARKNPRTQRAVRLIVAYRQMGHTFQAIADMLNANAFKTARGKSFGANTVKYLLDKYGN